MARLAGQIIVVDVWNSPGQRLRVETWNPDTDARAHFLVPNGFDISFGDLVEDMHTAKRPMLRWHSPTGPRWVAIECWSNAGSS